MMLAVIYRTRRDLKKRGSNIHIDGSQPTVRYGTTDCASQGESRVESKTAQLLGAAGGNLLHHGIDLRRAGS
jgi:hypothetical protein